jgi:hypothetical protein
MPRRLRVETFESFQPAIEPQRSGRGQEDFRPSPDRGEHTEGEETMLRRNWSAIVVLAAGVLLAPQVEAQTAISADGVIESKSGGFKFPDGTVQTSAAVPIGACPTLDPSDEMIWVGGVCIDKYEASIWDAPVGGNQITGAIPCDATGQDCVGVIFARSVAGVEPKADITWFQAQQALANSGKRLPTNAEWQMAVAGTSDLAGIPKFPGPCYMDSGDVRDTGSAPDCISGWGAFDMVGNLYEWVADWVPASTACPGWGTFSDDFMCLAGASTTVQGPGALIRGGDLVSGNSAGPFAVEGSFRPSESSFSVGFRGAR